MLPKNILILKTILFLILVLAINIIFNPASAKSALTKKTLNNNFKNQFGISTGKGKPDSLTSLRFHYRHHFFNKNNLQLSADFSFARLHSSTHNPNNIDIFAASPVINYYIPYYFSVYNSFISPYLEIAVGPARKSSKQVGSRSSGSKWTFQDILGMGLKSEYLDLRITYMHYSNGSLAKPNPGIDIWPMFLLSYRF